MNKILLENLPTTKNGLIKWTESIGYEVEGVYKGINFKAKIINHDPIKSMLTVDFYGKGIFDIRTGRFKKCGLGVIFNTRTLDFRIEIGTTFIDDKRNFTIIDREYRSILRKDGFTQKQKYYKYKCNKCGYDEGYLRESQILNGTGCACCNSSVIISEINSIWKTDRWMVDLGVSEEDAKKYTKSSRQKVTVVCPDCETKRKVIISNIYREKSILCPCSSDGYSYPNKLIFGLLDQLKINFITEYSPSWCIYEYKNKPRKGRYDIFFELENNKYIVEMDGAFHFHENYNNGQTIEDVNYIDNKKDRLAEEHGIEVVRIDCEFSDLEYIKNNIINSKLNELFDLSIIDWLKIEEFALSNRVKEICDIKRNNPELTVSEISKKCNIGTKGVSTYLKKGTILGWCYYNPVEEKKRSDKRNGEKIRKRFGKPVEIFKDGVSLGIFPSCSELARQSEELFGVKLNDSSISSVCAGRMSNGKRRLQHKGFTFKYI